MMKKIVCFMLGLLAMAGCGTDDSTPNTKQEAAITVSTEKYSWDATVTEQQVEMTAKSRWTAKSNVGWCEPWKSSGDADDKLVLWVSPNITGTARSGELKVTSGGETKTIRLEQPAYSGSVDNYEYKLPVVFHVLWKDRNDDKQYVKKGRLAEIIKKVNKLYSDNGVKVQFEMAKYDEDGNELEEAGVMRHEVDFDDFDPEVFLSDDSSAKPYSKYGQNYKRFINLYTFKFGGDGEDVLGISPLPMMPKKHPLDSLATQDGLENYTHVSTPWGCCINNESIYSESDKYYMQDDVVVTVAHELGHYLGLLHTFSENGCEEDDACSDTKLSNYPWYLETLEQRIKEQLEADPDYQFNLIDLTNRLDCISSTWFNADNIMDYAYCLSNVFTKQQTARMRHVLYYCAMLNGPKLEDYLSASRSVSRGASAQKIPQVLSGCPSRPTITKWATVGR